MAIGDFRLTNSRYVRPGVYIGYVRIPRPSADPGVVRYPCAVGRGSRLAVVNNLAHRRSYIEDLQLSFSKTPPYQAVLQYSAIDDKSQAFLYKMDRTVVPTDKWNFKESNPGSGVYDRVEIQLTEFDKHATYLIDYQSTERDDINDPLKFNGVRDMKLVGDTEGQNKYVEYVDYRVVTDVVGNSAGGDADALIPAVTNSHTAGRNTVVVQTAGATGTVEHAATSTYTHPYAMTYSLECTSVAAGVSATFELRIAPLSGGNSQANKVPEHSAFNGTVGRLIDFVVPVGTPTTVTLSSAATYGFTDGIILEFDTTGGEFIANDAFTWDSFGPGLIEISSAHDNDNQFAEVTDPVEGRNYVTTAVASSSGVIEINPESVYTGTFDRHYKMQVFYPTGPGPTGDGPSGDRAFDLIWSAWDELPYTEGLIQIREATPTSLTKIPLEQGIYLDVNLGSGHADTDVTNIITAAAATNLATAVTLAVDCQDAINKHDAFEVPHSGFEIDLTAAAGASVAVAALGTTVTGTLTTFTTDLRVGDAIRIADAGTDYSYLVSAIASDTSLTIDAQHAGAGGAGFSAYTGPHQAAGIAPVTEAQLVTFCNTLLTAYSAHIIDGANAMHTPIDSIFTLDNSVVTNLATAVTALNDLKYKYNRHRLTLNFVEGDVWTFTAKAARQDYTAKDDRLYTLTAGTVVANTSIPIAWYTDTYEGSFGSFTVTAATNEYANLPDNLTLAFRNFPTSDATEQFALNDKFIFTTVNENEIDWSLRTRVVDTISADEVFQDVLGQVTGTPLSYYVILSDTPEDVIYVRKATDGTTLSYSMVLDNGENTPYIMLGANPSTDVEVRYEHRGKEPDPGNIYYVSAHRVRLPSEYDVPRLFYTREDMERGLGPKTSDNLLWIAGDVMFDTAFFGAYFCQVRDSGGNQIFSTADFRRAIQATEKVKAITDLVVMSFYPSLGESKASVERMADPFQNAERMLWVGAPIGTPIGDVDTADSLVYLSKKTLQFAGDNPGRGHIVLLGNTSVTRSLVFDDNTTTNVALDGSFLAAYTAARNAAFQSPSDTLLRKDVSAFNDMLVYNEAEETILASNNVLYCNSVGGGLFRYQESMTVDTSAPDLREISAMNQKIYVTRKVARDMDDALVAIVPPSAASGVMIVRAFLVDLLSQMISQGIIAPYGQEINPPTQRPINPTSDVYVFVDEIDRTLYHFGYFFNIRYPIKRLFGLYSVDTKFWDARQ